MQQESIELLKQSQQRISMQMRTARLLGMTLEELDAKDKELEQNLPD